MYEFDGNLGMTFYEKELKRINATVYSNHEQIETVIGIRNHMDNNYGNELNLEYLSRVRFVSKYHMLRIFKRHYGLTPRQYLIDKRIEKSKERLKNGMSVTEACFAVGFESLGSFSTLFKTKTGKSPSNYQKEQFSRSILNSES
ncbi:MAG: AraC family transcriptional regulator [Bacteroidota bacterium]